jgi:competence protein ComEC
MFTCIAIGESIGRKTNIFNTLASSAFILLCINPFSLWDVGFRLSYTAVLSIVIFMTPLYQLINVKNKWLNYLWKLNAVTLSAQILTLPVVVFHFHQFPNLFLFTNLVAVPLSGIILTAELALLACSVFPALAYLVGKITGWMIFGLNFFIEWCNRFSFAVTDNLQMNGWECLCLFAIIIFLSTWLFHKKTKALSGAVCCLLIFGLLRMHAKGERDSQKCVIVYHIPGQQAIDFVSGRHFWFKGNDEVRNNPFLNNFHLKPSRVQFNISEKMPEGLRYRSPFYFLEQKCILLLDSSYQFSAVDSQRVHTDLLILSNNPRVYLQQQALVFDIKQVVADGSNPDWKIKLWKKDCDSLGIPFHQTNTQGAFILNCK